MSVVKDIAAIIGLILSVFSLATLFSTKMKAMLASIFNKYGGEKQNKELTELKEIVDGYMKRIEKSMAVHDETMKTIEETSKINFEFTKQQCRNIIKDIFYKYYDTKVLPLYEYKTLRSIEDIYINKCHGNSYAQKLIEEMNTWKIDYTQEHLDE